MILYVVVNADGDPARGSSWQRRHVRAFTNIGDARRAAAQLGGRVSIVEYKPVADPDEM